MLRTNSSKIFKSRNFDLKTVGSIPGEGNWDTQKKHRKIDFKKSSQTLTIWCGVSKDHIHGLFTPSKRFCRHYETCRKNRKKIVLFLTKFEVSKEILKTIVRYGSTFYCKKKYSCSRTSVWKNIYLKNILESEEVTLGLGHQGFNKIIPRKSMSRNSFWRRHCKR